MTLRAIPFALATLALLSALTLSACDKSAANNKDDAKLVTLLLGPEDKFALGSSEHGSGPLITGSVQPERRADIRAEVPAVVLRVLKENGELVHRGDLLVQLDPTSIRDSLTSAEEAVRAARDTYDQADRQYQRQKTLLAEGMISQQAMDDAANRRTTAQSDRVAADARLVAARQQMEHTEVRAPFDGVISERKVSPGDTAQIGKELLKVIDPSSMRFEGFVSADRGAELKVGQKVDLRINGAAQSHIDGRIRRIDVSADPVSRQLAVLVDFDNKSQAGVAGLYGEGHVQTNVATVLMLGDADLQRDGDSVFAWVVRDGKLHRQPVTLGERDERSGDYVLGSGLKLGEVLLRNPSRTLVEGTPVKDRPLSGAPTAVSASAASAS